MQKLSFRLIILLILSGIIAGMIGVCLNGLIHAVQSIAFTHFSLQRVPFSLSIELASPVRRLCVIILCGLLVGCGWYWLHKKFSKFPEVNKVIMGKVEGIPFISTFLHGLLQVITVSMGSPLGREVAPREITAAITDEIEHYFQLSSKEKRLLIACASGAGLASVYNVPVAAVLFIIETLILRWRLEIVIAASICCITAVTVSRFFLGDFTQYQLPILQVNPYLNIWAVFAGPFIAIAVKYFDASIRHLPKPNYKSPRIILISILCFTVIGLISMQYPEILGNGQAGNHLTFSNAINWKYAFILFALKWAAILLAFTAGAYGGRITPSMMMGGLLALSLGVLWNNYLPYISTTATSLIGAAVFLGLAQKMPLTAGIFMLEISRFSPTFLVPIGLCFLSAMATQRYLDKKNLFFMR